MARKRKPAQQDLRFRTWGGRRMGAGRPKSADAGVSHAPRERLERAQPAHATLRMLPHVWNLRSRRSMSVFVRAIGRISGREGFRVVHFAVQGDHVHLIVEVDAADALARGMQALTISLAKGLNRMMGRSGAVFSDRYHAHPLRSPREVRNALAYVLLNHRSHLTRHGGRELAEGHDPYSSAAAFDGWKDVDGEGECSPAPSTITSAPEGWLLRVGWRRHGLISPDEVPALARLRRGATPGCGSPPPRRGRGA